MSDIGKDMSTDVLIYGQLAKAGDGYNAKIFFLDVKKKSKEKELTVRIPGGSSSDAVRAIAKKAYADLVGGGAAPVPIPGTLKVEANVVAGEVFVDDEHKETLQGGTATLQLAEGRYRVAIESPGHRRKEITVAITGGETVTESFLLVDKGEGGGKQTFWKPAFAVTIGLAAVLTGLSTYEYIQSGNEIKLVNTATTSKGGTLTEDACPNDIIGASGDDGTHFDKACSAHKIHVYTFVGAVVFGVAALGSGYMAFVHKPAESATKTSARKPLLDRIAITPVLSSQTQGAVVGLTW
jgi:hypothetical protein